MQGWLLSVAEKWGLSPFWGKWGLSPFWGKWGLSPFIVSRR